MYGLSQKRYRTETNVTKVTILLTTFKNDMRIQHSLSRHFYLLYLLLNSCDGNWRVLASLYAGETVQLLQQETPHFISPDLCPPNSPVDPETRSTTEFGD